MPCQGGVEGREREREQRKAILPVSHTPLCLSFIRMRSCLPRKREDEEEEEEEEVQRRSRRMKRHTPPSSSSYGLHVVVRSPLTPTSKDGSISCRPIGMMDPICFEWSLPKDASPSFDESGSEAWEVSSGKYRIRATDATGARSDVSVEAEPYLDGDVVVVEEYRVTPSSTERARDGSVEVVGEGVQDGWRFLWTNGSITEGPLLRNVPSGLYAATPLSRLSSSSTDPVFIVQKCDLARVPVSKEW